MRATFSRENFRPLKGLLRGAFRAWLLRLVKI